MSETDQIAHDLEFVRQAVERQRRQRESPLPLAILWSTIMLGGCIWSDVNFRTCGLYWLTAPFLGFIASSFLGWKQVLRIGEVDRQEGIKQGLHWSTIFIGIVPVMALAMSGRISWMLYGQLAFLISGIVYCLA